MATPALDVLCGGPSGVAKGSASLRRRLRRRRLWTDMVARTRVCRSDLLMYRPLPVMQRKGTVLELDRLIQVSGVGLRGDSFNAVISACVIADPVGCDDEHESIVTYSAAINTRAAAGTSGDVADTHGVKCDAAMSGCEGASADEEQAEDQWQVEQLRETMRANVLNAMPFLVVVGPRYISHRADVVEEFATHIRAAAACAPFGVRQRVIAHASEDAERILDAAVNEKCLIAKRLQAEWPNLHAAEKSEWEARHQEAVREYDNERLHYTEGRRQDEPKRPPGAFLLWLQDSLMHEWNSRRTGIV